MTEDEERILKFLLTQASERKNGPTVLVSDIVTALPDLSRETIDDALNTLASEDLFDHENAVYRGNRTEVILSTGAWRQYGSKFLGIDVEEELESVTDYLIDKGTVSYPEIAENFNIPLGRVWMAMQILREQSLVRLMHGEEPVAKWIGG